MKDATQSPAVGRKNDQESVTARYLLPRQVWIHLTPQQQQQVTWNLEKACCELTRLRNSRQEVVNDPR